MGTVTNAQLMRQMQEQMEATRKELEGLRDEVQRLRETVAQLAALQSTEAQRCPYREDIARSRNNIAWMKELEGRLRDVEVRVAGIASIAGIATGVITSIVTHFLMRGGI